MTNIRYENKLFDIQFGTSNGQTQNFNLRLGNDTSESAMEIAAGKKVFKSIRTIRIGVIWNIA